MWHIDFYEWTLMQQPQPSLLRVLGPWMATAVVVGTVIGSGVFKKARNVSENVPEFGLAMSVWAFGGVLALLGAFALAEVAVLFPRAGGNYVFLREAYGRCAGFLWGWVEFWIIRSASIAALASMFTDSFHDILKELLRDNSDPRNIEVLAFWPRQFLTTLVILALAAINIRGTRLGGGLQVVLTILKVGSLLFIIALPFAIYAAVSTPTHPPNISYLSPTWPSGWGEVDWGKFGAALVGVLWAYHGWMNIGPIAGEVIRPNRNIPLALIGGILILIGLYCGANLGYYLIIPRDQMRELKDTTVATEFCLRLLGPVGGVMASAIIMTSVFGSLNGNLLVGPRVLFAMGKDSLVPRVLSRLHPRLRYTCYCYRRPGRVVLLPRVGTRSPPAERFETVQQRSDNRGWQAGEEVAFRCGHRLRDVRGGGVRDSGRGFDFRISPTLPADPGKPAVPLLGLSGRACDLHHHHDGRVREYVLHPGTAWRGNDRARLHRARGDGVLARS